MQRHYGGMAKHFDRYDFIIRLEVQILGFEPVISRTLELPRDLNFAQLDEVLEAALGWTGSHLHQFIVGGLVIGAPEYLEEDAFGPDERSQERYQSTLGRLCGNLITMSAINVKKEVS